MQMLLLIAYIAIGIFQIAAGIEGMHLYFGLGTVASVLILLFSFCIPVVGAIGAALATYYGARYGWRWEWWQALLLAAPGPILSFAIVAGGGLMSAFQRRTS